MIGTEASVEYVDSGSPLGVGVTEGVPEGDSDSDEITIGLDAVLEYFALGLLIGALDERRWPLAFISSMLGARRGVTSPLLLSEEELSTFIPVCSGGVGVVVSVSGIKPAWGESWPSWEDDKPVCAGCCCVASHDAS